MKKLFLFSTLIITFVILFEMYPTNQRSKEIRKEVMMEKYTFYKIENKERYSYYKKNNPDLTDEEIIIRVNLNLDKPFYTDVKETKNIDTNTVLVNKYNYLNEGYIPSDLKELSMCSEESQYLKKEAKEAFENLCKDATKQGLNIRVISSYRSYNYQKILYERYVKEDGTEKADTYSARPGFSEHQTGLVIDVDNINANFENFESTNEFKWMQNNAHLYGFILRYPKGKEGITGYSYESWHYRYVGKDIAKIIKNENITFDEYYIKTFDN